MNPRRLKRKEKKNKQPVETVRCIVFLSSDENDSFEQAEKKEDKQWRYVSEYADAHGLIPMKIVRRGCMAPMVANQMFLNCLEMMRQGRAEALLVANMNYIAHGERDIYEKVGIIRENGFRVFAVDDGELKMCIHPVKKKAGNGNGK